MKKGNGEEKKEEEEEDAVCSNNAGCAPYSFLSIIFFVSLTSLSVIFIKRKQNTMNKK